MNPLPTPLPETPVKSRPQAPPPVNKPKAKACPMFHAGFSSLQCLIRRLWGTLHCLTAWAAINGYTFGGLAAKDAKFRHFGLVGYSVVFGTWFRVSGFFQEQVGWLITGSKIAAAPAHFLGPPTCNDRRQEHPRTGNIQRRSQKCRI